jgi:hypothetical protein
VAWDQPLIAEPKGPAFISRTVAPGGPAFLVTPQRTRTAAVPDGTCSSSQLWLRQIIQFFRLVSFETIDEMNSLTDSVVVSAIAGDGVERVVLKTVPAKHQLKIAST